MRGVTQLVGAQLSSAEASLPLTADGEHDNRVDLLDIAIQGYVATSSAADDQLPRFCGYGPADERIVFEYIDSLNDFPDTATGVFNRILREVIEDAIKVVQDFGSQLDSGHPQRASFLAAGRLTVFPAIRSSR